MGGSSANVYKKYTYILNLLTRKLESQNIKYHKEYKPHKFEFDLYCPEGISQETDDPTVFEIKIIQRRLFLNQIQKYKEIISRAITDLEISQIIFVVPFTVDKEQRGEILTKLDTDEIGIQLWDKTEVIELVKEFAEYDIEGFNLSLEDILDKIIEKEKQDRTQNIDPIKELKEIYQNDDLTLFLGAGVSKTVGLPNWTDLLTNLILKLIEEKISDGIKDEIKQKIITAINDENNSSPLVGGRYIRSAYSDRIQDFKHDIVEILYDLKNNKDEKLISSDLVDAIVNLCITRGRLGLNAIVTYNYDDILETNLDDRGVQYMSIYSDGILPDKSKLPIYHVHGYLPRDLSQVSDKRENKIVLSDKEYHRLYNQPYIWSNFEQLKFLKETTCLFIGQSMNDPNLRRLLEISSDTLDRPKHFAFMKKQLTSLKEIQNENVTTFTQFHHELVENSLKSLGVNIIWVDDWSEIPKLLNKLRD